VAKLFADLARRLRRAPAASVRVAVRRIARLTMLRTAMAAAAFNVAPALPQEILSEPWSPPPTPMLADPAASEPTVPYFAYAQPEPVPESVEAPGDGDALAEPTEPVNPEIAALLERIEALEAAAAPEPKPAEEPAEKPAEKKDPLAGWTDMSTDKWTLKLGGHLQLDWINWADRSPALAADPLARDYFEFRRARLLADGTGYGQYDFRLMFDAEPESGDGVTTPVLDVKDAYFSVNELPGNYRYRIGNFFVPFSLEQVTNDTMNIFLERSIPTQGVFAADREVGMALYSHTDDLNTTWCGGVFFDSISESLKERIDSNQGQRLSGRMTHLLYYDEPSNGRYLVHTGAGVLYTNDQDNAVRVRARPQIHEGPFIIDTLNLNANSYTTGNLEFATVMGPLCFQSEAFYSTVNFNGGPDRQLWGSYAYVSWFLTGEHRVYDRFGQHGAQFGRPQLFTNAFWVPGCHGWGAWEAKCRWSNLSLQDVSRGVYNDITCGLNWYWTERIRIMFDWIHPITDTVGGATPFGDTTADIIGTRFDFNW
jgi:phosphate-selective porin OprO and OprP